MVFIGIPPSQTPGTTVIKHFLNQQSPALPEIGPALTNIGHSLFELRRPTGKRRGVVQDLLLKKKRTLSLTHEPLALIKDDLFLARFVEITAETYLLKGIIVLPPSWKGALLKYYRQTKKLNEENHQKNFICDVLYLKEKWSGHHRGEHIELSSPMLQQCRDRIRPTLGGAIGS